MYEGGIKPVNDVDKITLFPIPIYFQGVIIANYWLCLGFKRDETKNYHQLIF